MENENTNVNNENANDTGENMDNSALDRIEDALSKLDKAITTENNKDDSSGAAENAEEAPEIQSLRESLEDVNSKYDRLVKAVEKLVLRQGATTQDGNNPNNEPFKNSVEPNLGDDGNIPSLENIQLG